MHTPAIVTVSDPWEFGTEHGTGPFEGEVVDSTQDKVLFRLSCPLMFNNTQIATLACCERHDGSFGKLESGMPVPCSMTPIPPEREDGDWHDLSWWRGGVGLLGDITFKV
jgi:hypothetical protein